MTFKNNLAAFSKLIGTLCDRSPHDLLINSNFVPLTGCLLINAIGLLMEEIKKIKGNPSVSDESMISKIKLTRADRNNDRPLLVFNEKLWDT